MPENLRLEDYVKWRKFMVGDYIRSLGRGHEVALF